MKCEFERRNKKLKKGKSAIISQRMHFTNLRHAFTPTQTAEKIRIADMEKEFKQQRSKKVKSNLHREIENKGSNKEG